MQLKVGITKGKAYKTTNSQNHQQRCIRPIEKLFHFLLTDMISESSIMHGSKTLQRKNVTENTQHIRQTKYLWKPDICHSNKTKLQCKNIKQLNKICTLPN